MRIIHRLLCNGLFILTLGSSWPTAKAQEPSERRFNNVDEATESEDTKGNNSLRHERAGEQVSNAFLTESTSPPVPDIRDNNTNNSDKPTDALEKLQLEVAEDLEQEGARLQQLIKNRQLDIAMDEMDKEAARHEVAGTLSRFIRQHGNFDEIVYKEARELYERAVEMRSRAIANITDTIATKYPELDPSSGEFAAKVHELLIQNIEKRQYEDSVNGLGSFELNSYVPKGVSEEHIIAIRVVHFASNKSILFVDEGVDLNNTHNFKKWLARQFVQAQREVLVVSLDKDEFAIKIDAHLAPPSTMSFEYWKRYYQAISANTELGLAVVVGSVEIGLMLLLDRLTGMGPTESFYKIYGTKILFSILIGSQSRTLTNWTDLETRTDNPTYRKIVRVLKRSSISLAYGMMMAYGFNSMGDEAWLHAILNMVISNHFKDEVFTFLRVRSNLRMNSGNVSYRSIGFNPVTWWFTPVTRELSRKNLENQSMRVATGLTRYMQLAVIGSITAGGVASGMSEADTLMAAMTGHILFLGLSLAPRWIIPPIFKRNLRRAEEEYRQNPTDENRKVINDLQLEIDQLNASKQTAKAFIRTFLLAGPYRRYLEAKLATAEAQYARKNTADNYERVQLLKQYLADDQNSWELDNSAWITRPVAVTRSVTQGVSNWITSRKEKAAEIAAAQAGAAAILGYQTNNTEGNVLAKFLRDIADAAIRNENKMRVDPRVAELFDIPVDVKNDVVELFQTGAIEANVMRDDIIGSLEHLRKKIEVALLREDRLRSVNNYLGYSGFVQLNLPELEAIERKHGYKTFIKLIKRSVPQGFNPTPESRGLFSVNMGVCEFLMAKP